MMKTIVTLTWTMKMNLIRQYDEYDEKKIILTFISCIDTFTFDQFDFGCYKHISFDLVS
jgi:hypothetical protein